MLSNNKTIAEQMLWVCLFSINNLVIIFGVIEFLQMVSQVLLNSNFKLYLSVTYPS